MAVAPQPKPPAGPPTDAGPPQLPDPVPYERAEFATAIVFDVLETARARLAQIDRALGYPNGRGTNTYCDIVSVANGTRYVLPIEQRAAGKPQLGAREQFASVAWDTDKNGAVKGWIADKRSTEAPTPDATINTTPRDPSVW